jgi:hypothetical protein
LAEKQGLPLNPRLLGVWAKDGVEFTIAKYSETEYSVRVPKGFLPRNGDGNLRGYPINFDGISLLQLRETDEHFTLLSGGRVYDLASLELIDNTLTVRMLNLDGVGMDNPPDFETKSSADLKTLFRKRKQQGSLGLSGESPLKLTRVSH